MKMSTIPNYGDHMAKEEFLNWVKEGIVNEFDGSARYATGDEISDVYIDLRKFAKGEWDDRFTHVVWFNK